MILNTRKFAYIIIFTLIGNFLLPPISFFNIGIRLGDFLVIFIIPLAFFSKIRKSLPLFIYFMFLISVSLSIFWGYTTLNVPFSLRDLNEILRLTLPLVLFLLSYRIKDAIFFDLLYNFIIYGSFFLIIIALLQLFFSQQFIGKLLSLYISEGQLAKISSLENLVAVFNKRLYLTGGEPNTGAAIAIFFCINNLSMYLSKPKFRYLLFFSTLSIIIGLTGSRTGILALFTGSFAVFFLNKKRKPKLLKLNIRKILLFFCVFLILVSSSTQSDYIKIGIRTALSGENSSLNARLIKFYDAFELFKTSPFLGWGPAKAIHDTRVDGEYFLLLRRYGIIGFSLSLVFLLSLIGSLLKRATNMIEFYGSTAYSIIIATASYIISMMVIMITNNFISGYQIFLPILGTAGALHALTINASK